MIVKGGLTEAQSPDTIWIGTKKALENPEQRSIWFKVHIEVFTGDGHRIRNDFIIKVGDDREAQMLKDQNVSTLKNHVLEGSPIICYSYCIFR